MCDAPDSISGSAKQTHIGSSPMIFTFKREQKINQMNEDSQIRAHGLLSHKQVNCFQFYHLWQKNNTKPVFLTVRTECWKAVLDALDLINPSLCARGCWRTTDDKRNRSYTEALEPLPLTSMQSSQQDYLCPEWWLYGNKNMAIV